MEEMEAKIDSLEDLFRELRDNVSADFIIGGESDTSDTESDESEGHQSAPATFQYAVAE
jgi:hypothetical protein